MDLEKVYKVEFMEYTDSIRDTVYKEGVKSGEDAYLHVGVEPFLVRESQIPYYQAYGRGFRNMHFVGYLPALTITVPSSELFSSPTMYMDDTPNIVLTEDPNTATIVNTKEDK